MGKALEQIEDILGEGARFHDGDVFGPGFPGQGLGGVDADTVVGEEQVADTHDKHFVHTILGTGVAPAGGGMWCPPCPVSHGRRPCRRGCPGRDGSRTGDSIAARRGSRKGMTGKGGMPGGWNMLPASNAPRASAGAQIRKRAGSPPPFRFVWFAYGLMLVVVTEEPGALLGEQHGVPVEDVDGQGHEHHDVGPVLGVEEVVVKVWNSMIFLLS